MISYLPRSARAGAMATADSARQFELKRGAVSRAFASHTLPPRFEVGQQRDLDH